MTPGSHRFGGSWTEVKLDAIAAYLEFYNKVLLTKPQPDRPFRRWYVDGFAGSGTRTAQISHGGLLEGTPIEYESIELAGSAIRALEVEPQFDKLIFIEGHKGRFADLSSVENEYPSRNITCYQGDANEQLKAIFSGAPWKTASGKNFTDRAVCFLDPYGMNVEWSTLKALAETRAVDVWYLFPLEGVNRQLAHKLDKVDKHKRLRLDQIFGTADWENELYETHVEYGLFDDVLERAGRAVTKKQIEQYARNRLGSIFSYVSESLPLVNDSSRQLFSLLCLANPATEQAKSLIKKGVTWVLKEYGAASR